MEPSKIVYVKDYRRNLQHVSSDPRDGYVEYPIYKIPVDLISFDESIISRWHPQATITDIQYSGRIYFQIGNLEFEVKDSDQERNVIEISTHFQTIKFEIGKMLNNLTLFQRFTKSFILQGFVSGIEGFEGISNDDIPFTVKYVSYSKETESWLLSSNRLHICIDSDEFSDFIITYEELDDLYTYIGVGYDGLELWFDIDRVIDLDVEISNLQRKKRLVDYIKHKLYNIYGIGMKNEQLTDRQQKASEEAKNTATLFKENFAKK